jgi:membrane associated rhomboid family serine protease
VIPLKDNVPTARFPLLTVLLIVANFAVFAWQLTLSSDVPQFQGSGFTEGDKAQVELGAIPYRLTHPGKDCALGVGRTGGALNVNVVCQGTSEYRSESQDARFVKLGGPPWWVTVFTSMFMHGGIFHIGFNMLFLWIFGNNVEDAMGRVRFLLFYLLAGVVAAYTQVLVHTDSTVPLIGASGAIAGVLGAYAVLLPRARVLTVVILIFFFTVIEIPALLMLGIYFLISFLLPAIFEIARPTGESGGVADFAHVGGFLFGLALVKLFARRPPGIPRPAAAGW